MHGVKTHPEELMDVSFNKDSLPIPCKPAISLPRKSRQLTALIAKTYSSQRRAIFNNFCCLVLNPLILVLLCAIAGAQILALIQSSTAVRGIFSVFDD
jgi:hypothetical protein